MILTPRTHILLAGLLWSAFLFAAPPPANAGQILGAPTYIGLSNGLVGWWTFDGKDVFSNNDTADRSGNGNTGTLTSGPAPTAGKIGQALSFDGTDDYVGLGNTSSLGLTGSMSISAWVYAYAYPGGSDNMIAAKSINGDTERGWEFNATLDNELETMAFKVSSDGTAETVAYGATELTTGRWYHMIGVYNASAQTINVYLDGSLDTDFVVGIVPSSQANSPSDAYIGARDFAKFWNGLIDDVRIYNRALTTDEIKRLYKIGNTLRTGVASDSGGINNGLVGYWSFDGKDMAGNRANDLSGQGNHGTLTNGPARSVGKIGQALEFDQIDDYVDLGTMDVAGSAMTISAWVYRRAVPSGADCFEFDDCRIIDKSISTSEADIYWMISTIWDGSKAVLRARLKTSGTTDTLVASSGEVKDGEWTHVVMRYDGATLKLIKDTVEVGSMSKTGSINAAPSLEVIIGRSTDNLLGWWGKIDDVRVYNRALTADEIKRLYKIGNTLRQGAPNNTGSLSQGLVGWWTMDGADTSQNNAGLITAYDRSGNANKSDPIESVNPTPIRALGRIGQGLSFNGSTNLITIPPSASIDNITDKTISMWMKTGTTSDAFGSDQTLVSKINQCGATSNWALELETDLSLSFFIRYETSAGEWHTPTDAITLNTWHHVAMTYSSSTISAVPGFYVDGVKLTSNVISSPLGTPRNEAGRLLNLGSIGGLGGVNSCSFFGGTMDDVRFYNRILSEDEIKRLYNIGR